MVLMKKLTILFFKKHKASFSHSYREPDCIGYDAGTQESPSHRQEEEEIRSVTKQRHENPNASGDSCHRTQSSE